MVQQKSLIIMIRTFVAVDLPEELRTNLTGVHRGLEGIKVRLVSKENIHFTLKFLGDIEDSKIEVIKEGLEAVEFDPVDIDIAGLGAFPKPQRPRVLWAGIRGDLGNVHMQVEDALQAVGFSREKKTYSPHVTIGRFKRFYPEEAKAVESIIDKYKDHMFGSFTVDGFSMKKSTLTPRGPIYEDLLVCRQSR